MSAKEPAPIVTDVSNGLTRQRAALLPVRSEEVGVRRFGRLLYEKRLSMKIEDALHASRADTTIRPYKKHLTLPDPCYDT